MMHRIFLLAMCLLYVITLSAQPTSKPKLFLDCRTNCDFTFFRQELPFIDFMRDRQDAKIFMMLTRLTTGNGGSAYLLTSNGDLDGTIRTDSISFLVEPNVSANITRRAILNAVKRALLPYLLSSNIADKIEYTVKVSRDEPVEETVDPWNAWTFSTGVSGRLQNQALSRTSRIDLRFTANRTTDDLKLFSSFAYNKSVSKFNILDDVGNVESTVVGTNYTFSNRTLYVLSLTDKWSGGLLGSYRNSIFSNYDHSIGVSPAIEYNIFPYTEASQRQFAIRYEIGGLYNDYVDTTFRAETSEWLLRHNLSVDFSLLQDWGQLDLDIFSNQFLNQLQYWSLSINPEINVNLIKGLAVNVGSFYALTYDLVQLPKGTLSLEEVLLQNRQLNTNYNFNVYFGLNYRFGSSLNNVVNTRF